MSHKVVSRLQLLYGPVTVLLFCPYSSGAFTAFVSASLEQRIGNLFFFGLIPAAGFYAGGYVLSQLLMLGTKLCEMIAEACFRFLSSWRIVL